MCIRDSIKTKYLTFGIDADSIKAAKPRLERIETDILNNFKRLGVAARTLDGKEKASKRLKELLPQATLHIVPNAGHELNKYAPNTIAEILNN